MNEIYNKSSSIPNFAKNVMLHLFDKAELLQFRKVAGRGPIHRVVGRFLDEARVETIRKMVEENAGEYTNQTLWQTCIGRMNQGISQVKKTKRVNNQAEHSWIHMPPIK